LFRTLLLALVALAAHAQEPFPAKPVTIVVPYPPGGQADLAARPLANSLQQILKQPFVVLNRPGASGAVGNRAVASANADGYTILVTLVSITTIPEVEKMFGRPLSYTMDQFAPLALLAADPPVLVVGEQQPWKSVKELLDDAKKRPDDIVYSHSGLYGPSHLPMEMLLHEAGAKMRGLPAVGGGPSMQLVLGGSAAMWASPPAMAVPQVAANKMRVLASFGAKRHPAFPDAPTLKELGYAAGKGLWSALYAPAATPRDVLDIVHRLTVQALNAEPTQATFKKQMIKAIPNASVSDAKAWDKEETAHWRKLTETVKIERPE